MHFGILGPFEVADDQGRELALGGQKQRAVLAILVLHAGEVVSSDRLIDELWGEYAPATAAKTIQVYVSNLRKALGGGVLVTRRSGYTLVREGVEVDVDHFESLAGAGRRALREGDPREAADSLRAALGLWRGAPLSDFRYEPFAQDEIARLEEVRAVALEDRIDADLALGEHRALVGELEFLVRAHPLRERVCGQLMVAMYRSGRQAEALEIYQTTRAQLVEELGLEPGPALSGLQAQILTHSLGLAESPEMDRPRLRRYAVTRPPAAAAPMIGRQVEVRDVSLLLESSQVRLVTLTGTGGVGKTRLALAIAQGVESHFRSGVCWIELAGVSRAEDVGSTVARALAIVPVNGEGVNDALRRHLVDTQLLLVMDNFEHVLGASDLVGGLVLSCPELTILVTSREALDLKAEHRIVVEPLPLPAVPDTATLADLNAADASTMFIEAARRLDARFAASGDSAPAIARLCARLDGLPLALELAAARTGLFSVEELDARLREAICDLGTGARDAPARQRTLHATIEWSYRLLTEELRSTFRRLAVFAGGATLEAAEAVTGATAEAIEALIAKSLLHRRWEGAGATRVAMLQTVTEYARRLLAQDPAADAVRRDHLEHYLQLAETNIARLSTHEEPDALAAIDREIDNLRAALEWALTAAPNEALRLVGHLGEYWWIRGDLDGLPWFNAALRSAGELAPGGDRARAHHQRAHLLFMRHDHRSSREAVQTALALYRESGDHAGISEACHELIFLGEMLGETEGGEALAAAAYRHALLAGSDALVAKNLGRLARTLPAPDRTAALEHAVELLTQLGNYQEVARAYNNAAFLALNENRPGEAIPLLSMALIAAERTGVPATVTITLGNVGFANLFTGDVDAARMAFSQQLQLCAEHAFRYGADAGLAGLAAVLAVDERPEQAARLLGAARALGYPTADAHGIDRLLERDFFARARARYGLAAWERSEATGAAMSLESAMACAHQSRAERTEAARKR
jgi:predicted ATPase/DNA-binding SARP family transcriptional activator